jgi:hypothetical protein
MGQPIKFIYQLKAKDSLKNDKERPRNNSWFGYLTKAIVPLLTNFLSSLFLLVFIL